MSMFPVEIITAAQHSQEITQVPACITLSQWALESGYGKYVPPDSNNPFGIKWFNGCPYAYVTCLTKEWTGHRFITIEARFIKFPTIADAFVYHAKMLTGHNGAFSTCLLFISDWSKWLKCIGPRYATDPHYEEHITQLVHQYNLQVYNVVPIKVEG